MNKENKKKKWVRPKLIVLVRGKPGERVLANCKSDTFQINGPSDSAGRWRCFLKLPDPSVICEQCNFRAES